MSATTIFKKEKRLKKGHILACLKEIPFESSKCTFSDIVKMQVLSAWNALKTHNKKDGELKLSL